MKRSSPNPTCAARHMAGHDLPLRYNQGPVKSPLSTPEKAAWAEGGLIVALLTTRYRDIPWEEARQCQPTGMYTTGVAQWNRIRGKTIHVRTPPDGKPSPHIVCSGPFYRLANLNSAVGDVVCPHIAEIGD